MVEGPRYLVHATTLKIAARWAADHDLPVRAWVWSPDPDAPVALAFISTPPVVRAVDRATAEAAQGFGSDTWGANLMDPDTRRRVTPGAILALTSLANLWDIDDSTMSDLVGELGPSGWRRLRDDPPSELTVNQLTRISLLVGIAAGLARKFAGNPGLAAAWPNRPFRGADTPLAAMRVGGIAVMAEVRAYLDVPN